MKKWVGALLITNLNEVILQQRDINAIINPERVALFGGQVEDNENIEDALKREIKEEISIDIDNYQFFGLYKKILATHGEDCECYVYLAKNIKTDKIIVNEGSGYILVSANNDYLNKNFTLITQNVLKDYFVPDSSENNDKYIQNCEFVLTAIENDENEFFALLKKSFNDAVWLQVFLTDSHHGFKHGNQVREAALKLIANLNTAEREQLAQEGKNIYPIDSEKFATLAFELAAVFHDCGRFNEAGEVLAAEQNHHHILSAQRAAKFCETQSLDILIPYVEEAILCHDFQSAELTPALKSPQSIIGKLVQSSDQMGWFHPDSVNRTLAFNKALGAPFFDSSVSLDDRLAWTPGIKSKDSLTVMLSQLFGPTGPQRFGIESARNKVETYKIDLENSIINMAAEHNSKNEVEKIIAAFKKEKLS
ncbi:MAG: NUDIX hydrolase [Patescibacteria group bacterium]